MFNTRFFGDPSDSEDLFSSGEESAKYSDQISSDLEAELYSRLHHSVFDQNTNFTNVLNGESGTLSNSVTNGFCKELAADEDAVPVDVEDLKVKRSCKSEKHIIMGPTVKKKSSSEGGRSVKVASMKAFKTEVSSDNDSMSDDLICVDEWGLSEDNLMTNLQGEVNCSSTDDGVERFPLNGVNTSDDDIIYIDNEPPVKASISKSKKMRQKFRPITVDSEHSSDSSPDVKNVRRSLPTKLRKEKLQKKESSNVNSESWHVDPEDKVLLKKRARRYHDRAKCTNCRQDGHNAKFCPQAKNFKCYICGGSHLSAFCDKKVCSFCYQLGHQYQRCPNKFRVRNLQCEICQLMGHTFNRCPDLWRRFHATTTASESIVQSPRNKSDSELKFCFNCGANGHFGHECIMPHSRVSCSPSWPYVVSYKYPKAHATPQNTKSATACGDHSSRKKHFKGMKQQCESQGPSSYNPTPVASDFPARNGRKSKKSFFKKRKLFFQEQNFDRTPKRVENELTDYVTLSSKKKSRSKKRQRKRLKDCKW